MPGLDRVIKDLFKNQEHSMYSEYLKNSAERVVNPSDFGRSLEHLLRVFLIKHLPFKFGVERGYIINSFGGISKEKDIIIYDKLNGIAVSGCEDYIIIPVECVYAAIEVKAVVNKKTMLNAAHNIKSIKSLSFFCRRDEKGKIIEVKQVGRRTINLLFGFSSKISLTRAVSF